MRVLSDKYNLNKDGYLLLAETVPGALLNLENKFDYLTNGRSRTGYAFLRHRQLSQNEGYINLNYLEAIDAYKECETEG